MAPDKFKGTLTAREVSEALELGLRSASSEIEVDTALVADGGDGMLAAFEASGFTRVPVSAADALSRQRSTHYLRRGTTAIIELAEVCGLDAVGPIAPLSASSAGVGQVLAAALEAGCEDVVLGIGGSASTDGGAGLVQALGARLTDRHGEPVGPGGAALLEAGTLDLTGLHPALRRARIEVASDVDNPLVGPTGAASVYGPQKGASREQVSLLDAALRNWASVVAAAVGVDRSGDAGAGAAGGVGLAAMAILQARLQPGIELVLERTAFAQALAHADLVITGEGAIDHQTLRGKAPLGVARAARAGGVTTIAVAGRCALRRDVLRSAGFAEVYTLAEEAMPLEDPTRHGEVVLRRIGARIGRRLNALSDGR